MTRGRSVIETCAKSKNRPQRTPCRATVANWFGNKLDDAAMDRIVGELVRKRKVIAIDRGRCGTPCPADVRFAIHRAFVRESPPPPRDALRRAQPVRRARLPVRTGNHRLPARGMGLDALRRAVGRRCAGRRRAKVTSKANSHGEFVFDTPGHAYAGTGRITQKWLGAVPTARDRTAACSRATTRIAWRLLRSHRRLRHANRIVVGARQLPRAGRRRGVRRRLAAARRTYNTTGATTRAGRRSATSSPAMDHRHHRTSTRNSASARRRHRVPPRARRPEASNGSRRDTVVSCTFADYGNSPALVVSRHLARAMPRQPE